MSKGASSPSLQHLRGKGDDFHVSLGAKFAGHRAENTSPYRISSLIDQHRSVPIKSNIRTVGPAHLFGGAYDNSPAHLPFLHRSIRRCLFDTDNDDIANGGVLAVGSPQGTNTHDLL